MTTSGTADSTDTGLSVMTEAQLAGILSIADDAIITVDEAAIFARSTQRAPRIWAQM